MTLESLFSYLWHVMPLTGWGTIFAGCLVIAGLVTYIKGRSIMRSNSFSTTSVAIAGDGLERKSVSYSVSSDYRVGKSQARLGVSIVLFALVALTGFLRLW